MKKKSPQDATRRNTQAANKKFKKLFAEIKELKRRIRTLERSAPRT